MGATLALFTGSALSVAALVATRPHLTGAPASWSADDVAVGTAWIVTFTCAVWLAGTTVACLGALARGRPAAATRIAAFAPPIARRMLQGALVTSAVLLPTAAYATPARAPLVLHVGDGGRLTTVAEPPADEIPVVRAPPTTTTSAPARAVTTSPSGPSTIAPVAPRAPSRAAAPARVGDPVYVVRAGDNLWRIASNRVTRTTGTASDATIARYWRRLIAANRTSLRSGDPSLIFPGEVITLPLD
jgi:hypothetical protein